MSCTSAVWVGAWLFTWQGGRLADVCHESDLSAAVDAVEVRGWDWQTGRSTGGLEDLEAAAREWVECYGASTFASAVRGVR